MKKIHLNVSLFDILLTVSIVFWLLLMIPTRAAALTPPSGFLIQTVTGGLNKPVTMAWAADGRIFVGEKDGAVRVIKNGVLQSTPVLQLQNINTSGDRGLLGLALDP